MNIAQLKKRIPLLLFLSFYLTLSLLTYKSYGLTYETYHLLNLLFASVIFIICYELILVKTNKSWLSLSGPVFILLTPRFFGRSHTSLFLPFAETSEGCWNLLLN